MFCRYLDVGVSFLKDKAKKVLCRKLIGYDANALYLECCGLEMQTGFYIDYELIMADWFPPSFPYNQSVGALEWLTHITISRGVYIQYADKGNEKVLGI